jgi:hypothetical protein
MKSRSESNRALGAVFRETVLSPSCRDRYADFGPTLAAEKLSELHGLDLGVETLRQWMIEAGLTQQYVSLVEAGHQNITRDTMAALARAVGRDVIALLRKARNRIRLR